MKKIILFGLLLFVKQIFFSQCLNGIYTIGGTSPSYTSITQAVNTLSVNGVCGPVTFNIRPGTYIEKNSIPNVVGTSSLNTITFQAENGDSSSVIIQAVGTISQNYVFNLSGTRYIWFKHLTLKNTSTTYQTVFNLGNSIYEFNLENSIIDVPITSSTFPNANRYVISAASSSNLYSRGSISNCKITGGQRGFMVNTASCNAAGNWRVINNNFIGQYEYSILLLGVYDPYIFSNKITTNTSNIDFVSITLSSCGGQAIISKNYLTQTQGTGILLLQQLTSNNSQITNNVIRTSGTGGSFDAGIYFQNYDNFDVFHNTVIVSNNDASAECVTIASSNNINVKNNIFLCNGTGTVYYNKLSNTNVAFDYNCVYSTSGLFARTDSFNVNSFLDWNLRNWDLHSINANPQFISSNDFHILSDFSQNLVLPYFPAVSDDIEGTLRDTFSPYFGAYEFFNASIQNDAGIQKINKSVDCIGNHSVNILLKNYGTTNLSSVIIGWTVNGIAQPDFNWNGNLSFYDTLPVAIGNVNFQDLNNYTIKAWAFQPNSVTDQYYLNDTAAIVTLKTAMSGTYTIGGASPSFTSISSAVAEVIKRGICGDVTLNIRNGIYSDSIYVSYFKRTPLTSSLIIQSESNNNTSVEVSGSHNYLKTVVINGSENVKIKDISIYNAFGVPAFYISSGKNLEINNCLIFGGNYAAIQGSLTTSNFTNLKIIDNAFSPGIDFNAINSHKFTNVDISRNRATSSGSVVSVVLKYIDTLNFRANTFSAAAFGPSLVLSNINAFDISNNNISSNNNGMFNLSYLSNGYMFNNMLSSSGTSSLSLIEAQNVSNTQFINNSLNSTNTNSLAAIMGFTVCVSGTNKVFNNVMQNKGAGSLIKLYYADQTYFKNNAYNFTGSVFGSKNGAGYPSLTNWRNAVLTDTNSFIANPWYVSNTDLHANNVSLVNAGLTVNGIFNNDFDNQPRNIMAPTIGADEFSPFSVDASVNGFDAICSGSNNVGIRLFNNGSTNLTSVNLGCKINSTTLPIYNWTGNLAPGTETIVNVGSYNFGIGTNYSLTAWSDLPNGTIDVLGINDTTSKIIPAVGLSGIYTIGGSSPSFSTIVSAVSLLKAGGVCGPVVFNIRDGIYNEQIIIPNIKGVSSANTITFQSENLDSSLVSIEYNSTSTLNYIMRVDSTDYITFYKLGFKPLNSSYSDVILLNNKANHTQIKNCAFSIIGSVGTSVLSNSADSILVANCRFKKGFKGVIINGVENNVLANYFEDQSSASISGGGSFGIIGNKCYFPLVGGQAILFTGAASSGKILKNKIEYGVSCNAAMSISFTGSLANQIFIANNFISLNGGIGIKLTYSQYLNIWNNSINQTGTGSCMSYTAITSSESKNNIFYNNSGYCIITSGNNSTFSSDYNCFYSPTNALINNAGTYYTSLSAYNLVTMMDGNSVNTDPLFMSYSDLHISNSTAINNAGAYITGLVDDIDGEYRSITTPDIGADEVQTPIVSNVWPGDTDYDLVVGSQDLYAIGLGYGYHKYARDSISNLYIAHSSYNWWMPQANGVDFKHADCNGDSTISMSDTLAINLNYSLPHAPKALSIATGSLTDIYLTYNKPIYHVGDTVKADVMIGSATNIKNNMYGLSFKLNYDESMVKFNSEKMIFNNSWIGNVNLTKIKFSKISHQNGLLDASLVRITHTDTSGYGKIGTFEFVINDTVSNDHVFLNIYNANQIDHNGINTSLVSVLDSVMIDLSGVVTGTSTIRDFKEITLHPNPSSEHVIISFTGVTDVDYNIELKSMDGKTILTKHMSANNTVLDLNNISKGIYVLRLVLENGSNKIFKLVVQ